jgi:hypothetical protein
MTWNFEKDFLNFFFKFQHFLGHPEIGKRIKQEEGER